MYEGQIAGGRAPSVRSENGSDELNVIKETVILGPGDSLVQASSRKMNDDQLRNAGEASKQAARIIFRGEKILAAARVLRAAPNNGTGIDSPPITATSPGVTLRRSQELLRSALR